MRLTTVCVFVYARCDELRCLPIFIYMMFIKPVSFWLLMNIQNSVHCSSEKVIETSMNNTLHAQTKTHTHTHICQHSDMHWAGITEAEEKKRNSNLYSNVMGYDICVYGSFIVNILLL